MVRASRIVVSVSRVRRRSCFSNISMRIWILAIRLSRTYWRGNAAAFFAPSETSQAAGKEYLRRLGSRVKDQDLPVSNDAAVAELAAIRDWGTIPPADRYSTLKRILHLTLIVHGNKDIVVIPINALILAEHLPNAQLIVYPDSSDGAQFQHPETFLAHMRLFLDKQS